MKKETYHCDCCDRKIADSLEQYPWPKDEFLVYQRTDSGLNHRLDICETCLNHINSILISTYPQLKKLCQKKQQTQAEASQTQDMTPLS